MYIQTGSQNLTKLREVLFFAMMLEIMCGTCVDRSGLRIIRVLLVLA